MGIIDEPCLASRKEFASILMNNFYVLEIKLIADTYTC